MDDASPDPAPAPADQTAPELELRRFIVTPTLVAMNVAYFLAMVSVGVPATSPTAMDVLPFGANFGALTINGEWWRLLSSTFIHFGVLHLAFNMWCLLSLGNIAERLFGNGRFLLIYLLSGLGGSAASLLWHPDVVSAGASGAVFGMAGALATFIYFARIHLPERAARDLLTSIVIFIAFNLAFGFTVPGIDNAGHLGGLLIGAILGASLRLRRTFPAVAAAAVAAVIGTALLTKSLARDNPTVILAPAMMLTATDRAGAAGTMFLNVRTRDWSSEILERLRIPPEWLPPTHEGPQITGRVSAAAAEDTGLEAGTPVVGGGGDQAAQAVGVGAVRSDIVALTLGTSGVIFASTDKPIIEPKGRLHAFCSRSSRP